MRTAIIVVSLIAAAVAEAPYHLPRPAPHAPSFEYQAGPARQPARPLPQQSYSQNGGYNYQQPSIQPAFVPLQPQPHYHPQPAPQPQFRPQPAPQPHYHPQPAPQPQPHYHPQPAPQPQPHYHPQPAPAPHHHHHPAPQPAPQPNFNPGSGYHYQQPSIQPAFVAPQPQPQPLPQPQPIQFYNPPAPQPQPLPAPLPLIPSTSYGIPQPQIAPRPQPAPLPAYLPPQPQPAPVPAPAPAPAPIQYPQQQIQQGYSYSQPAPQFPLQSAQAFSSGGGSSSVSSYQADSAQYSASQGQIHGEALDSLVVDKVQNIIKESEHSSARDAGYLSLVSGVSLESARPSVEISSFVHTGPVSSGGGSYSVSQGAGSAESSAVSAPSADYGLPVISANSQSSQSSAGSSSSSIGFLPNAQPAASYGPPNKK